MRLIAAALIAAGSTGALAADPPPGREKARPCVTCHGPLGVASLPDTPHLAGQPRIYLEQQLKAFRSGKRSHEVMAVIARALTDADIQDLAEWYSLIEISAREKR